MHPRIRTVSFEVVKYLGVMVSNMVPLKQRVPILIYTEMSGDELVQVALVNGAPSARPKGNGCKMKALHLPRPPDWS